MNKIINLKNLLNRICIVITLSWVNNIPKKFKQSLMVYILKLFKPNPTTSRIFHIWNSFNHFQLETGHSESANLFSTSGLIF